MSKQPFLSKYINEENLRPSKKVYSVIVDGLLLILFSVILIISGMAIASNVPAYKEKIEEINSERIEMYKIEEDAKIYEFEGTGDEKYDQNIDLEKTFEKYCLRHILLSYEKDSSAYGTVIPSDSLSVGKATYDNDSLAFFYVNYSKNNALIDYNGVNEKDYYINILKANSYVSINQISGKEGWYIDPLSNDLPYLTSEFSFSLYQYLFVDDSNQAGLTSFNLLHTTYEKIWNKSCTILFQSDLYKTHYDKYLSLYGEASLGIDLICFIGYLLAFLICITLPQIIFKNGRTLGYLIFKGVVISNNKDELVFWQCLVRNVLQFVFFFGTMLVSCFFAGGLNSGWMFPIITLGGLNISFFHFTVFALIFPIINVLVMLIRKDKCNITDLASKTIVCDIKNHKERIEIEKNLKEEEMKKANANTVIVEDKPYFDSSSFNNTERKEKNK